MDVVENTRGPTILLASYPRCGNTLIRTYIEQMTGIYTGSDCDRKRNLNKELYEMGLRGESILDKSVLVVKSHFPERIGHSEFEA